MKKIKYGNRDKTKEKRNHYMEGLKDDEDDVCGAVLDSFNNDYLAYISGLVKNSKTPSKNAKVRTEERIERLFDKNDQKARQAMHEANKQGQKAVKSIKSRRQQSPKSSKSYNDLKNATLPLKKMKQMTEQSQVGQIRKQRQKSTGSVYARMQNFNPLKMSKTYALKEHYNRFPTQEAARESKFDEISLGQESEDSSNNNKPRKQSGKNFLDGLEQYLLNLQSHKLFKKNDRKFSSKNKNSDDLISLEQVYQQNLRLRKKVKKYEEKIEEIQQNVQNQLIFCRKQQKSYKNKITELTKYLCDSVCKINQQKDEIDYLKSQLKRFGRKAQFCAQKYDESSDEDMQEQFYKALRPSRANSEYKLKKKKVNLHLDLNSRQQ